MYWPKLTHAQLKEKIFSALNENTNYDKEPILGIPGTYLDREVFYEDAPFLTNAPYLSTLIANPNHIGCHTLHDVESLYLFKGTQKIETELISLCAEQVFRGEPGQQDGYVATGGTEANIEALWVYRNYFMKELGALPHQIAIVYSEDTHYSVPKGANLLGLDSIILPVGKEDRKIIPGEFEKAIDSAQENGKEYFIVVMNLSTTMFGSIDPVNEVVAYLQKAKVIYRIHVDAAFGGFIYPFVNTDASFSFQNPHITSFTIDGHKMLQTPYGTGIFLIRKGFMDFVCTDEARYIPGKDYTLCGSRSGANAVSVWMIMMVHGSEGWKYKMLNLIDRTDQLCNALKEMNVKYYRNPSINIVTIDAGYIPKELAQKYNLVPDNHESEPRWWKIVVMPHVKQGFIDAFIGELQAVVKHSAVHWSWNV